EAVEMVQAGTAPRIVQDESQATYEPPFGEEQSRLDWSAPVGQAYNLMRASNPQPGALTSFNGEPLKIFDVERLRDAPPAQPGTVTQVDDSGVVVALSEGAVRLKRVTPPGSGKIQAAQWAAQAGVQPGMRLGS